MIRNIFIGVLISFVGFEAHAQGSCDRILELAAGVYTTRFSLDDRQDFRAYESCSESSSERSSALDAFFKGGNFDAYFHDGKQARNCDEFTNDSAARRVALELRNEVFEPALKSHSTCLAMTGANIPISVSVFDSGRTVTMEIKNFTGNELQVFGILSVPNDQVTCQQAIGNWQARAEDGDGSTIRWLPNGGTGYVDCSIASSGDGPTEALPQASISIRTAATSFTYEFPSVLLNPPIPPAPPVFERINLAGKYDRSQAFWGPDGTGGTDPLECSDSQLGIPDGYRRIVISTSRENFERGMLACRHKDGFCDGADERCSNWVITEGCAVNSAWVDYARERARDRGIVFSLESLCRS